MYVAKVFAWLFIAYMIYKPFNMAYVWMNSMTPTMSAIAFVGCVIAYWSVAVITWFALPTALPFIKLKIKEQIDKNAAEKKQEIANRQQEELRKKEEDDALWDAPLSEVKPLRTLLKSNETAYACVFANLQQEKTVGYTQGYRGSSIRIAKGFSLKTKGARREAIKNVITVSSGELVVTDQRIIFSGLPKSFLFTLESLISVTLYDDGFGFSDGRTTHTLVLENVSQLRAFAVTLEKTLKMHKV